MEWGMGLAIIILLIGVLFTSLVIFVAKRFKRCPSNRVLVIFGKVSGGESARCVHGGAAFVLPLLQDFAYLSLEPIQIEVPLKDALSAENIRVNVPSVFTVAIGTQKEYMQNAAIRLLGLNVLQVKKQAEDIIFGQLRQVIASMSIEEINKDREKFLHSIQQSLEPELRKIGLVLINVNITDITDESGYIEAIGQKAASQAVQQARGDVAEEVKLGEVRVAQADRDKQVQVADASKQRNIGIREAQREQAVRVAELDKEQQIGEQTAAYQRETQVKEAERMKRVSVAEAEALAVKGETDAERTKRIAIAEANAVAITGENTALATVAESNAQLHVKQAEAYQIAETRRRQAEASVLEAQNHAMAKAALAEAARIEAERRAQLEAPAKAMKAQVIVDAEAVSERRRIEAQGEASAIFAKLEAEAKGQYEILAKKGEGLKRIVEACGGPNQAFQMLMLEHLDNLADSAAKAISNIKFDKIIVWEGGGEKGSSTANFIQGMARTLPPMLQVMRDIGGIELPESMIKLQGDTTDGKKTNGTPTHDEKESEPAKS
ncbi:MAG: SPFH domain-containing protein [Candidatus Hydrogenedentes bacterium]|nr:SPFH domain-containing protein [Candidatus Hydrogenedentota bacterium]